MIHDFGNRVVLVTGGAQGIGLGISRTFARAGAMVVLVDQDDEAGLEATQDMLDSGLNAEFIHADVSQESQVRDLTNDVLSSHGRLDVLINNAGVGSTGTLRTRSMEEWDRVININLRAPYMMAKYLAPALQQANPGVIINIASTRGLMSEAHTEPYSASKGGLLALTHSLAVSLGPDVRVNAISPGWIEVTDWKKSSDKTVATHRPEDLAQHPVGRVGTPSDIAEAALFLASPSAGFITGQNFVIDGGMTVKMIYEE